jgi:Ca-activated chloride channel family protein
MSRFLLIALIAAASVQAQDSPYTLKVDVSMVSVDVIVFSPTGTPVMGLTKRDFAIYEAGRRQEIQSFSAIDAPYNILLVIDRSGSMSSIFSLLIDAVNRFINNLRGQDRVALAVFDNSVKRLVNWRSVRLGSKQTVKLDAGGGTNFYGALEWAAKDLRKVRGRKAALFFTDGEDNRIFDVMEDAKAFRRSLRAVREAEAPFHFVGLDVNRAADHLKRLADETGGRIYFPEKVEELVPLYDQISRDLGISYTIGYLSDNPARDGVYRRIEVKVPGTEYRVSQSRPGYNAN